MYCCLKLICHFEFTKLNIVFSWSTLTILLIILAFFLLLFKVGQPKKLIMLVTLAYLSFLLNTNLADRLVATSLAYQYLIDNVVNILLRFIKATSNEKNQTVISCPDF